MSFPNYTSTDLVIENQAVRFIWAGWFLFVVFASLGGDTFILIASIRCKPIRLPAVIVVFIQHVAVSDLVTAVSSLVMQAVSLITNKWIFGAALCYMRAYFTFIGYTASSFLVSGMATSKLLILKYPLRASAWTAGQAHKACAVLWILSLYWPICFLSIDRGDVAFDYMLYACTYEFASSKWEYLQRTSFIILVIVPTFTVSATAVLILVVARRVARNARQGLRWQGVLTVVLTAAAYSFSFLPLAAYHISLPLVEGGRTRFLSAGWRFPSSPSASSPTSPYTASQLTVSDIFYGIELCGSLPVFAMLIQIRVGSCFHHHRNHHCLHYQDM